MAGDDNTFETLVPFTVTAAEQIFVVVDGYGDMSAGKFWLHVELN